MPFTVTVTSPMKHPERISRSLGIYSGKIVLNSYSQTLVKCIAITKFFRPTSNGTAGGFIDGICSVQIDGPSSGGQIVNWNYASGAFKCYQPVGSGLATFAGSSVAPSILLAASATVSASGSVFVTTVGGVFGHTGTGDSVNIAAYTPIGAVNYVAVGAAEAAANINVGTFGFVAIGFI